MHIAGEWKILFSFLRKGNKKEKQSEMKEMSDDTNDS